MSNERKKITHGYKNKPNVIESICLAGFTALISVNFTHPIEIIKIRQQIGLFSFNDMVKKEGVFAFWKGIQPAWMRESTYTSIKLGGYKPICNLLNTNIDKDVSPFYLKFVAGSLSGSIGCIAGNPFDVMKTKMMTNKNKYLSFYDLGLNLFKNRGIYGFYRGIEANILRACVLNGTKMACYDEIKTLTSRLIEKDRTDIRCQFISATSAGFFMTLTVSPFDNLRTRLMNQSIKKNQYNGIIDATYKIINSEGIMSLYRGFLPIWGRFAPQAILQLLIFDNLLLLSGFNSI